MLCVRLKILAFTGVHAHGNACSPGRQEKLALQGKKKGIPFNRLNKMPWLLPCCVRA
jgi:hypothetical protein